MTILPPSLPHSLLCKYSLQYLISPAAFGPASASRLTPFVQLSKFGTRDTSRDVGISKSCFSFCFCFASN